MKNFAALVATAVIGFTFTSCDNEKENQSKKVIEELSDFVDSVKKVTPEYTNAYWESIESTYEKKEAKAEAVRANLEASAQKEIDETKTEFIAFKESFKSEKEKYEQKLVEDKKEKIRTALFGENKVTSELNFEWVTQTNIVEVYKKFVDVVEANNKEYTEADWELIKDAFKALDDRRDQIADKISGKDKLKITEQKVRFGAIKAVS